jgi:o-succinylbenzoate synthase
VRLASVEVVPYALPFREPYVTARGTLVRREMVLLRVRAEDGRVGLGEAVPLSLRGGATLAIVLRELEALADLPGPGESSLRAAVGLLSAPARCAVSTALADLRNDSPAPAPPVACNATLVAGEPAAVAEDALRWAAEGFVTFKLKLGTGDDVGQIEAVRDAVGTEARIRVDANATWDVETARRTLAALEPLGVELVEQPVGSLEEMAELAASTAIPIAADESVEDRADAERAASLGACAYTGVKLSKVGGAEEGRAIAAVLPAYVTSALDGPVGIGAAARLAQELDAAGGPGLAHGLATQRLFASTVASVQCELRDGMLHPPPGPGLGVEIDEDALEAHRL